MTDDNDEDILRDIDWDDPIYNLELTEISKTGFDSKTPSEKINKDLEKFQNNFTLGHINARSLNKNIGELKILIEKTNFDVIAISESWLTRNTPKDRFELQGFNIIRNDRKNKRGGGVCLYVKEQYSYKKITLPNAPEMPEMLWVEVSIGHTKIAIGTLYKPPKIPYLAFVQVYDSLLHIYSRYEHAILTGDFNINMLCPNSYESKALNDNVIEPFALTQLIQTPTRITESSKTLIDLLLVNNSKKVLFAGACDAPGVSDHFFIYLAYSLKKEKLKPQVIRKRDFRNFDFDGCKEAAEIAHWENIFYVDDLDEKVTILENTINDILDKFAPYRSFKIKHSNSTPWITDDIKTKMNERDILKLAFNETGNKNYLDEYKILKNKVTSMVRTSLKKNFDDTINSKVRNSKDFYRAVKKLQVIGDRHNRAKFTFSPDKLNETFLLNNNSNVDDALIDDQIHELYRTTLPCIHKFSFTAVAEIDVIRAVNSIKTSSEGVDNINVFIIKLFLNRISGVLTHIINLSFEKNKFPSRWKYAIITPIPKLPVPLKASDFRPISLLTTLSKILEKIASKQISKYLNMYNLFDPYQSAYRENHSTTTALLKITEDILDAMDDSEITLLILLDFSKAFDTVNHRLLIEKLRILGFEDDSCRWMLSYLSDRYQMVKIGNEKSAFTLMQNGVPQGSILGPLLFLILVSDMRKCIWNGSYHMYADDTQLYFNSDIDSINNTIVEANVTLDKISNYCVKNVLKINENKSCFMFIGSKPMIKKLEEINLNEIIVKNTAIKRMTHAKNLGLTFDEVLSWRRQVNLCVSKATGLFLQFVRYKRFLSSESKKVLCESLVLSQFNYCDMVYMSIDTSLQKKIQKIQNMCVRFIFNHRRRDNSNYKELRTKIAWLSMRDRSFLHGLVQMYKILNSKAPNYLIDSITLTSEIHAVNTRQVNNTIWIGKDTKSKIHRNSFRFYISRLYNLIPENIKNCKSVKSFKNNLTKFLLNNTLVLPNP